MVLINISPNSSPTAIISVKYRYPFAFRQLRPDPTCIALAYATLFDRATALSQL